MRKLRAKLEAVVREYASRASPEVNIPVDENVSRSLSCKFGCSDCEHIDSAAETIGQEQDVGVTSRRDREGAEVVDADGNVGPFRQGHRDDGPMDRQPQGFPRLTLYVVVKPSPGADVHANLPVKSSSIRRVLVVPRWQEAVEWQACMTQGRMSSGR